MYESEDRKMIVGKGFRLEEGIKVFVIVYGMEVVSIGL